MKAIFSEKFHPVLQSKDFFELEAWSRGSIVCGVDEVGRGCLSGPIVAAAAVLQPNCQHKLLQDSKILTEKHREVAYKWLLSNSWYGIGIMDHRKIDSINIYQATKWAMYRAIAQLKATMNTSLEMVLVDAMPLDLPQSTVPKGKTLHFNKGESLSSSIAAASIIAKVTRDHLMERFEDIIPGYKIGLHKGYGTKTHGAALRELGPSLIQRKSFKTKELESEDQNRSRQHGGQKRNIPGQRSLFC